MKSTTWRGRSLYRCLWPGLWQTAGTPPPIPAGPTCAYLTSLLATHHRQRHLPAEPLLHPGSFHRLTGPAFPGGEALYLGLRDHGEKGSGGIDEDAELWRQLTLVSHPRV